MEKNQQRVQYTKEELDKVISVDSMIVRELEAIISDHLKKCGIFFRIFSRVKSTVSLEKKYKKKYYGPNTDDGKIQDLIGIRVVLYFRSDLDICKEILESCFNKGDWSETAGDTKTFEQTKVNGVFRLPDYLVDKISPQTFKMWIDKTFEVQVKTIFFEGWHEVEHDMRYKNKEIWIKEEFKSSTRNLNSILATLELCDMSMETVLEELAHDLYKAQDYDNMLRMHFRLKFTDEKLYDGLQKLLEEDESHRLAKNLFKCKREDLIRAFLKCRVPMPISVNTAVKLLNESKSTLGSEEIRRVIKESEELMNSANEEDDTTFYSSQPLKKLSTKPTFQSEVEIKPLKKGKAARKLVFQDVSNLIYNWLFIKYETIFDDLPKDLSDSQKQSFEKITDGFHVTVQYDVNACYFHMKASHIATNVISRIYETEAILYVKEPTDDSGKEKLMLQTFNSYRDYNNNSNYEKVANFSYPKFYKEICEGKSWKVIDCDVLKKRIKQLELTDDIAQFKKDILDPNRQYPMVCVVYKKDDSRKKNSKHWLSKAWIEKLCKAAWCYSIFFMCNEKVASELLGHEIKNEEIYLIMPAQYEDKRHENIVEDIAIYRYNYKDVEECRYNWRIGYERDEKIHNFLTGAEAFQHKCINQLKLGVLRDNYTKKN